MATSSPRARSKALLLVYPNPYGALDAEGMPNGIVRFDPVHGAGSLDFIGANAAFEKEVRRDARGRPLGPRDAPEVLPLRTRRIEFNLIPQRLPHTDYHVSQIRSGDLIPVDEPTAKICGLPFVPPIKAFEAAKTHAIAEWKTLYLEEPDTSAWPVFVLKNAKGEELPGQGQDSTEPASDGEGPTPTNAPTGTPSPTGGPAHKMLTAAAKLLSTPAPTPDRTAVVNQIVDAALGHVSVETPEARTELTALGHFTAERFGEQAVAHVLLALALLYLPLPHRQALEKMGVPILDEDGEPRLPLTVLGDMVVKARAAPKEIDRVAPQPALVNLIEAFVLRLAEDASPDDIHAAVRAAILPEASPAPTLTLVPDPDQPATTPGGSQ